MSLNGVLCRHAYPFTTNQAKRGRREAKGFNLRALEPFRADGLHTAMFIVPALAGILAIVLFAASRTVRNDVAKLNAWMKENQAKAS